MNTILFVLLSNTLEFGLTVSVVGFSIVIVALTLLVIVFQKLPKLLNIKFKKVSLGKKTKGASYAGYEDDYNIEGNVTAAIGLALHLYFNELHDEESDIVTIKKIRKAYSPWSSKIYEVTQNWPRR
ncbi:MAG: OadG family protein [Chlorobi bacterium]|nr:OadG family protein [Chlorobiota bacterium]